MSQKKKIEWDLLQPPNWHSHTLACTHSHTHKQKIYICQVCELYIKVSTCSSGHTILALRALKPGISLTQQSLCEPLPAKNSQPSGSCFPTLAGSPPKKLFIPRFLLKEAVYTPSPQVLRRCEGRGKDKASEVCFLVLTFKEEGHLVMPTSAHDWFRMKQSLQAERWRQRERHEVSATGTTQQLSAMGPMQQLD